MSLRMFDAERLPSNPKRDHRGVGKAGWYFYHAGFSPSFVRDVVAMAGLANPSVIVDPWNGAGTTTQVAQELGLSARGYDLNPVMVIIAKARLLGSEVVPSHEILSRHILRKAATYHATTLEPDPLAGWFTPRASDVVRAIERALQDLLIDDKGYRTIADRQGHAAISSLAAFYYLALFRTVRELLIPFRSSNPTWLKIPARTANRVRPSRDTIATVFARHVSEMAASLPPKGTSATSVVSQNLVEVDVADSRSLPLAPETADAIIASPPYCTRIDYAVATRAELAVLGYTAKLFRKLRDEMIGTSTMSGEPTTASRLWGHSCNAFLDAVRRHSSKASVSYYWKNHLQYFAALHQSLGEIARVARPGSPCVLVAQDSYYKDVHNDLPTYLTEIANSVGFSLWRRYDYAVKHTFAGLHRFRRGYRSCATATESVLWLKKVAV